MGEHDRSYELLNYENKWVAFLEPDEKIVGSGDDAYEAKMDAERNGTWK
ncbi:MAG: DUF5678 domain-containing protein [Blastocatellia bacterium]